VMGLTLERAARGYCFSRAHRAPQDLTADLLEPRFCTPEAAVMIVLKKSTDLLTSRSAFSASRSASSAS